MTNSLVSFGGSKHSRDCQDFGIPLYLCFSHTIRMADPVAKAVTASPSPSEKEKEESTTEGKDSSTPTEQRVSSPGPAPASSSSSGGTFTFFNTPELLRQGIEARNQNDLDRSCELLERALHSLSEKTGISEANYPPEYGEYFLEYGKTMLEVAREAIGNIEEMFLQGRADADAMEDPNEDFEVVWENLEVARVIYEKHPEYKESRIIDVHHALGEMHLELEQFEEAEAEFNTTLGLVLKEPKEGTHIAREERELHFLIGLTHNQNCLSKLRKIEETKKLGENTTEILTEATALKEKCLAAWSLAKSSMEKERESTENGDEKNQLSSVIQTLEEKVDKIDAFS